MAHRQLACVAAVVGALMLLTDSTAAQQPTPRPRGRVPETAARNIQEALSAYAGGDDQAVERWLTTPAGRASLPYVAAGVINDPTPWHRAKPAFLLEVAKIVATASSAVSREIYLVRYRTPDMLITGAELVAARPTPLGADASEDAFELTWYQAALGLASNCSSTGCSRRSSTSLRSGFESRLRGGSSRALGFRCNGRSPPRASVASRRSTARRSSKASVRAGARCRPTRPLRCSRTRRHRRRRAPKRWCAARFCSSGSVAVPRR